MFLLSHFIAMCGLLRLSLVFYYCLVQPFYGHIWPFMAVLQSFIAKYRFDWIFIVFSRGHISKFIWSCLYSSFMKARGEKSHQKNSDNFPHKRPSYGHFNFWPLGQAQAQLGENGKFATETPKWAKLGEISYTHIVFINYY